MFGFTRKTDYGLVALATLAQRGATKDRPFSARELAQENSLPLPLLMQILKDMHRAGILCSLRGAGGGYYLARTPDCIDLASVIEAIEGPLSVAACCDDEADTEPCMGCSLTERCPITGAMQRVNEMIVTFLSKVTIQNLIESDQVHWPKLGCDEGLGFRSELMVPRKDLS